MYLFFKEKQIFCSIKLHQIDPKYSADIVNVVNDYCSWKWHIFYGISTLRIETHYQQPSLLCSNGSLCKLIQVYNFNRQIDH
jgi:hypothetical protein